MKRIYLLNQGNTRMHKLTSFSDGGHGWLSCKLDLIRQLDLINDISGFSYVKGKSVYLEEDCDATKVVEKLKTLNFSFKLVEGRFQQYSRIRGYDSYSKKGLDNEIQDILTTNESSE